MTFDPSRVSLIGSIAALLTLAGCPVHTDHMGPDPTDDDDVNGDDDTAGDDDDTGDDDTGSAGDDDTSGDDDSTGQEGYSLEIQYSFVGFYAPTGTCEEAWVEQLWVDLTLDGVAQPQLVFPCDDTPILLDAVTPGEWTVTLASVTDIEAWDQPYSASDPVSAAVDDTTPNPAVAVELSCFENGWDDGCGGA